MCFEDMLGTSPQMQAGLCFHPQGRRDECSGALARESGTGKEMAAAAIHRRSARKDGPFVAINCNAHS